MLINFFSNVSKQCWFVFLLMSVHIVVNATESNITDYETEEDFFSEIPNVISATRIRQPLTEAPSSVTVIDRAMIEASGAVELAEVLRLVPGMQVSYPSGNQVAATYHGFSDQFPRKLQVLVDGRSVYQPSYANIDWLFIGVVLEDVEKIEVIRGANTPLYGANAVQGVINIITRQPYQQIGTYIGVTGGSLATRKGVVRHADSNGKLDYRVTAQYEEADGLPGNLNSTNDGRNIFSLSYRGVYQQSANDEIDVQLGVKDGQLGAGAELSPDPPAHDKDVTSSHIFLNWRHTFNNGGDSHLQFYRNSYNSRDSFEVLVSQATGLTPSVVEFLLEGRPDQLVDFASYDYKGDRHDIEWQYNSPRHGKWQSTLGLGARFDRVKSEVLTNRRDYITDTSMRIFANTEYHVTNSIISSLGLMVEDSNQFGAYASPRIALNYLFSSEHALRFSYTQAKRNPSLFESNFNQILKLEDGTDFLIVIRNLDPKAETVISSEIGFIGYWMDRRLFLDVKIFKEKTKDVIQALRTNSIVQPFPRIERRVSLRGNSGVFEVDGVEMQLKYQFGKNNFASLQYAYLDADGTKIANAGSGALRDSPESTVPENTVSALISHDFSGGYQASLAYYYVSDMFWLSDGDLIKANDRFDLRIAKSWRVNKNRLKAEFIVQNIGGDNITFGDENIFETRYFLRLGVDL